MRWLKLIVCVVLSTAIAVAQKPNPDPLLQADRDFNKAAQERRLDGWMEFMTESTVLDGGGKPVQGIDSIRKHLAPQWENSSYKLTWEPISAELFGNGKFGYTRGRWTSTLKDDKGAEHSITGDYLTVWRQQKDGTWKVAWDGGSVDPKK